MNLGLGLACGSFRKPLKCGGACGSFRKLLASVRGVCGSFRKLTQVCGAFAEVSASMSVFRDLVFFGAN